MGSSEIPEAADVLRHALDHRHNSIAILVGVNRFITAPESLDHHSPRLRDRFEVVAAFERGNDFSAAAFRGQPIHASSHRRETGFGHAHLRERIAEMAIETGGDKNEFGLAVAPNRHDQTIEGAEILAVAELGAHPHVYCLASSPSGAEFIKLDASGLLPVLFHRLLDAL